jgi:integrase
MTPQRPAFRFSDAAIIRLKAEARKTGKEIIKFEPGSGLGVRVSPTGYVSWAGQLRRADGGKHRWKVGTYPALTCDAARDAVQVAAGEIAKGVDLVAKKLAEEAERARAREAEERAAAETRLTLGVLADRWRDALAKTGRSPGYIDKARRRVEIHFPKLIDRPAARVTMVEVDKAIEAACQPRTASRPKTGARRVGGELAARNAGATLRAIFAWAAKKRLVPANPLASGVELPPANDRARLLSIAECRRIYAAAGRLAYPDQHFIRLLMLTGARRGEVAGLKWSEIIDEEDGKAIVLPPGRTKTKAGHHIALAPAALEVIDDVRRRPVVGGSHALSYGGWGPLTNFGAIVKRLERALGDPPIRDWVPHDFRAALVSHLAERGFEPVMLDRLLGHQPVKLSRIAQVYQRADRRRERREALETWAKILTESAEVAPMERVRR